MKQPALSRLVKLDLDSSRQYWLLTAITGLALGLRFYKLGEWSFWIDEVFTINHATAHFSSIEKIIQNTPPARNWVPLSVMATAQVINLLGLNEWSARLASALIGTITLPLLYFPVKRLFGAGVGLMMALLLAVAPWHLFWSQNARFYTGLLLFYALAQFVFYFSLERDRPLDLIPFLILFYLALSERLLAIFLGPVIVCYLVLIKILPFEKPPGLRTRTILLLVVPVVAVAMYEIYQFVVSGASIFTYTMDIFFGQSIDDPIRLASFIGFNLGLPLLTLGFCSGLYLLAQRDRAGLFMFISAVVPVLLLILISPLIFTKDRYIFFTLPAWAALAGVGVKALFSAGKGATKVIAAGVLFLLLADAMGDNLLYYTINNGNRRDWQGAFGLIQQQRRPGDLVISSRAELADYYLGETTLWMGDVTPEMVQQSGRRYWVVADSESVWVTGPINDWIQTHGKLIDVWMLRLPEDLSLRIYLYDPHPTTNP
jgi:hypothetical protein